MEKFENAKACFDQLESCGFKDEHGHRLEMNAAYVELKKAALAEQRTLEQLAQDIKKSVKELKAMNERQTGRYEK